jgi:hypothetical protein
VNGSVAGYPQYCLDSIFNVRKLHSRCDQLKLEWLGNNTRIDESEKMVRPSVEKEACFTYAGATILTLMPSFQTVRRRHFISIRIAALDAGYCKAFGQSMNPAMLLFKMRQRSLTPSLF